MRTPNLAVRLSVAGALAIGRIAVPTMASAVESASAPTATTTSSTPASAFGITSDDRYVPGEAKTLTGTGKPGTGIDVAPEGSRWVWDIPVGADGTWEYTLPVTWTEGEHKVFVQNTYTSDRAQVVLTPGVAQDVFRPLAVESGATYRPDAKPVLRGSGTPGAKVIGSIDGKDHFFATIGADGRWEATATVALPAQGDIAVVVEQFSELGEDRAETTITQEQEFRATVVESGTEYRPGATTTVRGKATPGADLTVRIAATPFAFSTEVEADGSWSVELPRIDGDADLAATAAQHGPWGDDEVAFTLTRG